ncbi:50S ribosomal protein L17 [Candidatus Daviesbacteria bacterium RIFCSPLOWO2_02_FULL_41_8]|uniref:50S ribosomal protein L17 n=3 Tax=Candidatus Daviesiibacteriota TaxID=1752718 RepID=A0A1F5NLZ5_9BACT|nr:MAG: 50S ribosomal protein L17 [Candidatus Daviesbacteria bacterium RIFCSPHIGHO2_01_FULL_41_23]OGE32806.1 MAG: 50S ribosomal protein L17 [Candidatus Daviesbacteria bacterium RIFCSPHIGHO2_02_FULL_41_10]OGE62152.1 MAG: 50S ribosomal protein L17 [Candidatus Daviesbacteria bacterium RIFCSPLOWO2_01_FULL_41_32]OGE78532.1 MAG: 50S ribosomal protein L17 [Candidatus Daviesbacteria bacterium RIFCSPLOWO2_02_FULL_41_8]
MRHRVYGKHLGRDKDQRKGLFKGLVYSLFSLGTIATSEAKAKAIKGLVDRIINSAKENSKFPKPLVQSFVNDKFLQKRLTDDILPKLGSRSSGYTKIIRMGTRLGDQTMMVKMSLIGAEELKPIDKGSRVKSLRTRSQVRKTLRQQAVLESSKKEVEKEPTGAKPETKKPTKKTQTTKKTIRREGKKV